MKNRWKLVMALLLSTGVANAAFVTIGNEGNADDTTGYGGVDYSYKISDHEVTIAEMTASGAGSGNENFWNDGTRNVGTAAPASRVSLYEAMKYCNSSSLVLYWPVLVVFGLSTRCISSNSTSPSCLGELRLNSCPASSKTCFS